jgi:arylsulfatase A-like enzyme
VLAGLLCLLLPAAAFASDAALPRRPKGLIVISIDTMRADRLGAYGAPPAASPAFDAFARRSVLFGSAFSNATWTVPSHAALFTGLFPSSNGSGGAPPVDDLRGLSPNAPTLASVLRRRGFRTAAFHSGRILDARWGFDRGFDSYVTGDFKPDQSGAMVDRTFEQAADWFDRRDASKPYFLFVHTFTVHRYVFLDLHGPGRPSCPPAFDFSLSFAGMTSPADPRCPLARTLYAAAAACEDEDFGRMMARLDSAGARDAVVVVLGDHGEALCDAHERAPLVGHGFAPYEDEIRVPLAIRLPGGRLAGTFRRDAASLVDVMPTVLGALGVPAPAGLEGRDLLASGTSAEGAVFAESDSWQMVREKGFKYTRHRDGHEELYDLAVDTGESRNLAGAAGSAAALEPLRARLRGFDAARSMGYRLSTRGRRGDRFEIRVESAHQIGYAVSFLTEADDRVERAADGRSVTATFVADADGDEDWLAFDESVPFIGGLRGPRPALPEAKPLRVLVRRNGVPVPAAEILLGGRPAARDGEFVLDPARRDAEVGAPARPDGAAVYVWRLKGAARSAQALLRAADGRASADDAFLREALKAEGYAP